ncbi:MAG: HDOD domain-containing protein [Pirellulaceae bacterium]
MNDPRPIGSQTLDERSSRRSLSPFSNAHRIALERLFQRVTGISSLPGIAQQVIALAADDSTTVEDLRQAIQTDPALTANVMRRVNSSYFGLASKIADLRSAISLLGFLEIRNICLRIFVSRIFDEPGSYRTYDREALWRHCEGTAVAARKIARVTGMVKPDEAYVAGLLHHIGTILVDQYLHRHFCRIVDRVDARTPAHIVEQDVLSFDHCQLGEFVVRKWNFPDCISDAIRYYAYPSQYVGAHRQLVNVVTLADFFCSRAGTTSFGVFNVATPEDEVYASLAVDRVTLQILWDEVYSSLPAVTNA